MSKLKWWAIIALLVCAHGARGQCTGQYANDPTFPILLPKDYAAQGGVTGTITMTGPNGVASHRITVGVGTVVTQTWSSNNATAAQMHATRSDGTDYGYWTVDTGNSVTWTAHSSDVGLTYTWWYNAIGGATSLDRASVTVINGTAGIYFQDGLDTNFYQQVITTFGGSSMLTSCQECLAGTTQHCINAMHTPYSTIQLTNSTSGETQLIQGVQAGNAARSNESVNGSASLAISVLPGDSGTISIDDKISCTADGVIFEQTLPKPKTSPSGGSWNPSVTGELAFTKVALKVPTHCTPLLDSNGNVIGLHCDVAYYCTARSSPPDYQPTGLDTYHYTNPALVPPFWMSMAPGTALVFGRNQPGEIAVWYFPFATLHGVLINMGGTDPLLLDILSPAWVSDNSAQDCTKWISGISPWYMPKW